MTTCSYTVPDKDISGDNYYGQRICDQPFVDWAWGQYGFNYDYWQNGAGFDDVCNTDKPLGRTLTGIWLLEYSAEDYFNEDWSNNILHWGCRYAREQISDLRALCGDGSAIARTFSDGRIELYLGHFYDQAVTERASTLIHEARHKGGRPHNATFPVDSVYGSGDGADSEWGYEGAWMYEALYLWWFYADGRRSTSALRQLAKQTAQVMIDNAFATHPGFTI